MAEKQNKPEKPDKVAAWLASDEGKLCMKPDILIGARVLPEQVARLRLAFEAGAKAK